MLDRPRARELFVGRLLEHRVELEGHHRLEREEHAGDGVHVGDHAVGGQRPLEVAAEKADGRGSSIEREAQRIELTRPIGHGNGLRPPTARCEKQREVALRGIVVWIDRQGGTIGGRRRGRAGDEIGRAGTARGHAYADPTRRCGVALGGGGVKSVLSDFAIVV